MHFHIILTLKGMILILYIDTEGDAYTKIWSQQRVRDSNLQVSLQNLQLLKHSSQDVYQTQLSRCLASIATYSP